jgi:uncharacterized membrane protein
VAVSKPVLAGKESRVNANRDQPPDVDLKVVHDIAQVAAQLRSEHRLETSSLQRAVDQVTSVVGRPGFVAALAAFIVVWVAGNYLAPHFGVIPFERPPFVLLQAFSSMTALLIAALILTTQRREDQLASHRSQLILELAVLIDPKLSKVIKLLEEGRRDNPAIADRVDDEAATMSTPSDARAVLDAIKIS